MEKTRHYLLLREKLESTLLLGQESLLSCGSEELCDSPFSSSEAGQGPSLGPDIPNERQRELAAKVSLTYLCSSGKNGSFRRAFYRHWTRLEEPFHSYMFSK